MKHKTIKNLVQQQRFQEVREWLNTIPYDLRDFFPVKISLIKRVERYQGDIYLCTSNKVLAGHSAIILSKEMVKLYIDDDNLDRFYQELKEKIAYIHKYHIPI